ncbi:hypothetical protein FA10DRAFT_265861 [Acaromyces ingoldii]|uniref:Uncharacterized protein n=1 Tax=Acaromyces ingoldii TaxID=215250 RepID=A0A316YW97_9BASI|nr:hypothetical protein FA10DRAFT_265861 [Acaromyces ingoldii]PWN92055.1 hypothetical protein FA10DRAFT_265861 [Acaromyces ingoldii]
MRSQIWSLAAREAARRLGPRGSGQKFYGGQAADLLHRPPHQLRPQLHARSLAPSSDCSQSREAEVTRKLQEPTTSDHESRLLRFLRSDSPPSHFNLPPDTTLLDAYLYLRQSCPGRLANLDEEAIRILCASVERTKVPEVAKLILNDIVGNSPRGADCDMQVSLGDSPERAHFNDACRKILRSVACSPPPAPWRRQSMAHDPFVERLHWCSMVNCVFSLLVEQGGDPTTILADLDTSVARSLLNAIIHGTDSVGSPPFLGSLFRHLVEDESASFSVTEEGFDGAFPMTIEGARLIDYLLHLPRSTEGLEKMLGDSPSSLDLPQTLMAAARVLEEAKAAGTEAATDELVRQASADGRRVGESLRSVGREEQVAEAALEMTLRSVTMRLFQKASRHQNAAESLRGMASFVKGLSLPKQECNDILGRLARGALTTILASQSHQSFRYAACDIIDRMSDILFAPEHLADNLWLNQYYDIAFSDKRLLRAATNTMGSVVASSPCAQRPFDLAATLGPRMVTALLKRHASPPSRARANRRVSVDLMIMQLGIFDEGGNLAVEPEELGRVFPPGDRASFLATLADAGLKRQVLLLYRLWGGAAAKPVRDLSHEEDIQRLTAFILFNLHVSRKRRRKESIHKVAVEPSDDDSLEVIQSHDVLQSLVRLLAKGSNAVGEGGEEADQVSSDIQTAYHVIDAYARSRPWSARSQKDYFALASAYFLLGRRDEALRVMTAVLGLSTKGQKAALKRPQIDDLRLLMEGLADIDLDKAIEIVVQRTSPGGEDERDSRLLTQMLYRCWSTERLDLACKLLDFADARGVSQHFFVEAIRTIVAFTAAKKGGEHLAMLSGATRIYADQLRKGKTASMSVALKLERLAKDALWLPSKPILASVIKLCVHEMGPALPRPEERETEESREEDEQHEKSESQTREEMTKSPTTRHSLHAEDRQAALLLLHLSYRSLSTVDFSASRAVIRAIHQKAHAIARHPSSAMYGNGTEFTRLQAELDDTVYLLRQTYANISGRTTGEEARLHGSDEGELGYSMPIVLFRDLMLAYVRLGDDGGATEILRWAREEAGVTLQDLEQTWKRPTSSAVEHTRSFASFVGDAIQKGRILRRGLRRRESLAEVMEWLADRKEVPKTKSWWRVGDPARPASR